MKNSGRFWALVFALGGTVPLGAEANYLLYTPRPAETPVVPKPDEGVLVERITIRRGDTLYKLSRRYSGRGSYYPQILLFNEIANPNLIHAGHSLLVPVSTPPLPAAEKKKGARPAAAGKRKRAARVVSAPTATRVEKPAAPGGAAPLAAEQGLYARAMGDYRKGKYRKALETFTLFVEQYPNSPLAPDAALYKAECLLKLAGD